MKLTLSKLTIVLALAGVGLGLTTESFANATNTPCLPEPCNILEGTCIEPCFPGGCPIIDPNCMLKGCKGEARRAGAVK